MRIILYLVILFIFVLGLQSAPANDDMATLLQELNLDRPAPSSIDQERSQRNPMLLVSTPVESAVQINPIAAPSIEEQDGFSCHASACDQPGCQCSSCAQNDQYVCIPHQPPNLPSSSLLQYFRSDACATGLWDGFAQERARQCAKHHKHIHGMCDCARKSARHPPLDNSLLIDSPCVSLGCTGCQNGCDSCRH